jgi:hypothetical protein
MWLTPVLAIVFALLLAGAISPFLPQSQANNSVVVTLTPSPSSTYPPMPAAQSAADLYSLPLFFAYAIALVIIGIAIMLLFFRQKPSGTV